MAENGPMNHKSMNNPPEGTRQGLIHLYGSHFVKLTVRSVILVCKHFTSVWKHHTCSLVIHFLIALGPYSGNNGRDGVQTHNLVIMGPVLLPQ